MFLAACLHGEEIASLFLLAQNKLKGQVYMQHLQDHVFLNYRVRHFNKVLQL